MLLRRNLGTLIQPPLWGINVACSAPRQRQGVLTPHTARFIVGATWARRRAFEISYTGVTLTPGPRNFIVDCCPRCGAAWGQPRALLSKSQQRDFEKSYRSCRHCETAVLSEVMQQTHHPAPPYLGHFYFNGFNDFRLQQYLTFRLEQDGDFNALETALVAANLTTAMHRTMSTYCRSGKSKVSNKWTLCHDE